MNDPSAITVAFQGELGAYSEAAVYAHFGEDARAVSCESFEAVFAAVGKGECAYGLVPIENSLAGTIHRNYDLLLRYSGGNGEPAGEMGPLTIVGEQSLRVQHCLIAFTGAALADIQEVISHPQALAQCEGYLRSRGLKSTAVYDTAGSVRILKERGDQALAAIASRRAAETYGMAVLAEGIEDDPANFTRFLAIAPAARQEASLVSSGTDYKTTIVFTMHNQPGALFKALSVFALRDLDLTKIESRPLVGKPWEYFFYIDFAGSTADARVARALEHLGEYASLLRVLGSYPRSQPVT